jgi:MFS family permease
MNAALLPIRVYWTALIGLFFDYYDLYLFIYLEKILAAQFALSTSQSNALQFVGLAGVGVGALVFGFLADRFGRGRMMLVVFGVYVIGIAGIALAPSWEFLLLARLIASLALGAEWGISHAFMAENVNHERRYRFSALLQFSILGGLLAAFASRFALPIVGWRWLFALSIIPVAILSLFRWRMLASVEEREPRLDGGAELGDSASPRDQSGGREARPTAPIATWWKPFLQCLALATLTIASGTVNVFFVKELPQSPWFTVLFWGNVAPGMLLGAWLVRRLGVRRSLLVYAVALLALSIFAWSSSWSGRLLTFALVVPVLNGIPFGLMGAYFNEVFARHRTMLSGSAYNLGRIGAGFAPVLITRLGLHQEHNYFLFTAALGAGVWAIGATLRDGRCSPA